MALPTAVLNTVAQPKIGKASGINYMARRLGTVFAIAIGTSVFSAHGHLGSPATVTASARHWSSVVFAALAAITAVGISAAPHRADAKTHATDIPVAA